MLCLRKSQLICETVRSAAPLMSVYRLAISFPSRSDAQRVLLRFLREIEA